MSYQRVARQSDGEHVRVTIMSFAVGYLSCLRTLVGSLEASWVGRYITKGLCRYANFTSEHGDHESDCLL